MSLNITSFFLRLKSKSICYNTSQIRKFPTTGVPNQTHLNFLDATKYLSHISNKSLVQIFGSRVLCASDRECAEPTDESVETGIYFCLQSAFRHLETKRFLECTELLRRLFVGWLAVALRVPGSISAWNIYLNILQVFVPSLTACVCEFC